MKLNLMIQNKKIIMPDFDLYKVNKNEENILIAIKNFSENEENDFSLLINNEKFNCGNENQYFYIETDNKYYFFDMSIINFENIKKINIDFFDINNIIKNKIYKEIYL